MYVSATLVILSIIIFFLKRFFRIVYGLILAIFIFVFSDCLFLLYDDSFSFGMSVFMLVVVKGR